MTRQEKALRKAVIMLAAAAAVLACLLFLSLRSGWPAETSGRGGETGAVAEVAGRTITEREWLDELKRKYGEDVLLGMVNRIAVGEEAAKLGVAVTGEDVNRELERAMAGYESPQEYYKQMEAELGLTREELREDARYRLLLQAVATAGIHIEPEDIDAYLQDNEDRYRPQRQLELSIIKVSAYEEAEKVLDRLEQGEDFAELAGELSIDEDSRSRGGSIGTVEENDPFLPRTMLEAAVDLRKGDIAGPFAMDDGYAVIRLDDITVPPVPDMSEIREEVRRELALEQAPPLQQVERGLREKYGVSIDIDNNP